MTSIITINYNGTEVTKRLIDSLEQSLCGIDYEIVVVDNASSEDQKTLLKEYESKDRVKIIFSAQNLGFSGGNNLGIEYAKGEYIMLLNNDTIAKDDFITPLVDTLSSSKEIGLASSKIMDMEKPNIIQFGGYSVNSRYMTNIRSIYNGVEETCSYMGVTDTPFAHGAAMMFRKADLNKVGLMPLDYFLYFEELDWSMQFRNAGFKIVCVGNSKIYHEGSHTMGNKLTATKLYYNTRNRLIFAKRNLKGWSKYGNYLFQIGFSYPKNSIKMAIRGEFNLSVSISKGVFDFLTGKKGIMN